VAITINIQFLKQLLDNLEKLEGMHIYSIHSIPQPEIK
jgi:hypothetical protein